MAEAINGNNKSGLIGVLIQGGAVAIALVAVYLMYSLASEHIAKNTEAWNNNASVISELKGAIENNTAATDRLERSMDLNVGRSTTLKIE